MHALARIHCALALLLLLAVGSSISAWSVSPCCLMYHDQVPRRMVIRYYEQKFRECKLHAIVFLTKEGSKICGNPSDEWVKDYMKDLD